MRGLPQTAIDAKIRLDAQRERELETQFGVNDPNSPSREQMIDWGEAAMKAGAPDYDSLDTREQAIDAITNILHAYHSKEPNPNAIASVLYTAEMHFEAEAFGDEGYESR